MEKESLNDFFKKVRPPKKEKPASVETTTEQVPTSVEDDELTFVDESPVKFESPEDRAVAASQKAEQIRQMVGERDALKERSARRGKRIERIRAGRASTYYGEAGAELQEGPDSAQLFNRLKTGLDSIPSLLTYAREKGIRTANVKNASEAILDAYKQSAREKRLAIPPDVAEDFGKLIQARLQSEKALSSSDPIFAQQSQDLAQKQIDEVLSKYNS